MAWYDIFTGGIAKSVESIAKEWIDTDEEKANAKLKSAEAQALMIKTLDPNGLMRRDISRKVSTAYMVYLGVVMILVISQSFNVGNVEQTKTAIKSLTDLFVPITTMFTAIVSASFGTNMLNAHKGN